MVTIQSIAIALIVLNPGSKDQQTALIVDENVKSI